MRRLLVLIDGEHYPPVIEAALDELRARGDEIVGLALLGGVEKLPATGPGGFSSPLVTGPTPTAVLDEAIGRFTPDAVVDMSDQPVLDPRLRMELACRTLLAGIPYVGTDFEFRPPPRGRLASLPSIAVIGTGKRTGKTAICGALARELVSAGYRPLIVAMGRGGPVEPEVIRPHRDGVLTADALIALADDGRHAASDHIEDAVMAGVTTIGTRRCGGGLAGEPGPATFGAGVEVANLEAEVEGHDLMLFEGSGSAIPPVHADVTVLVIPAGIRREELAGYMGPYRVLLADLVIVVDSADSADSVDSVDSVDSGEADDAEMPLEDVLDLVKPGVETIHVTLEPVPLGVIDGRQAAIATTAPGSAIESIESHIALSYGADIVTSTNSLSDRRRLETELPELLASAEVVVTELKAAGIDVVARAARAAGLDVVFLDNRPRPAAGAGPISDVAERLGAMAASRFAGTS